jgi:hypothetical protein
LSRRSIRSHTRTQLPILCSDVGGSRSTGEIEADSDIRIEFHQESQSWPLVTVDANPDYTFETVVEIPSAASRGPAMVVAVGDAVTIKLWRRRSTSNRPHARPKAWRWELPRCSGGVAAGVGVTMAVSFLSPFPHFSERK